MILGVTGTRRGGNALQLVSLNILVQHFAPHESHHGDCVGGDHDFHKCCVANFVPKIVIHPPIRNKFRVWSAKKNERQAQSEIIILPPRDYILRDHDIVDTAEALIAIPKYFVEEFRGSGTWATIRYARKKKVPRYIIFPDGIVVKEFGNDIFVPKDTFNVEELFDAEKEDHQ